jgi:hypothetical protein
MIVQVAFLSEVGGEFKIDSVQTSSLTAMALANQVLAMNDCLEHNGSEYEIKYKNRIDNCIRYAAIKYK